MAIVLCRPDKPPPPTQDRIAQRVFLKYEPVPASPYQGGHTKARSELSYDTCEPKRELVSRENYKRRKGHLQAGFHGPCEKSYREVGEVVLNNKKLFQDALGQDGGRSLSPPQTEVGYDELKKLPLSAGKLQLRAKTPAQFPEQLVSLKEQLKRENACLEASRRGFSLFKLLSDVEQSKINQAKKEAEAEAQRVLSNWRPPTPLEDDGKETPTARRLFSAVSPATEDKETDEPQQAVISIESAAPSRTQSPMETDSNNEDLAPASGPGETQGSRIGSVLHWGQGTEEQQQDTEQLSKDNERDKWYYQLCVLEWVLRAMQQSSMQYMTPFSKCWNVEMHSSPGIFANEHRVSVKQTEQAWDHFVRGGPTKKVQTGNVQRGRVVTGSRLARPTRLAQQQIHQSSHHLATASFHSQKSHATSDVSSIPEVSSDQDQSKNMRLWATPSDIASMSAQPYKPKSPPTIPYKEEKKAKQQKKLTPDQLKALESLVDEEFVYSKRQNKNRLKALLKEADERRAAEEMDQESTVKNDFPQVMFDLPTIKQKFGSIEEGRNMIVHEQLSAMEKNRLYACQQKFTALKMTGKYWNDIENMRESVSMETTAMAKKKLLMNYYWYDELDAMLPEHVKSDHYCSVLLANLKIIASVMRQEGPKHMSKKKLIKVLGSLKPWELRAPLISATVKFIITKVIYIVEEDYQQWLENHTIICDTIQLKRKPH